MENFDDDKPVGVYKSNPERIKIETEKGDELLQRWDFIIDPDRTQQKEDVLGRAYRAQMKQQPK